MEALIWMYLGTGSYWSEHLLFTLKAPITTAADDILIFSYFLEKTSLDFSCESSAGQTIHIKSQDLFSLKNKKNMKFKMLSASNFPWRFKG